MFDLAVVESRGMRGYYLRIFSLVTLSIYLNTTKGQHISLSITVWRFELTFGMGVWESRA